VNRFLLILVLLACVNPVLAQQTTYSVNTDKSVITYDAKHPFHAWTGVNENVLGLAVVNHKTNAIEKLALMVKVSEFDSKNANRDAHSLEVLEALSFPTVKFYATDIDLKSKVSKLKGELIFHGITKEIEVEIQINKKSNSIELKGNFALKPSVFEIELPSLLGISISDGLEIHYEVVLEEKK